MSRESNQTNRNNGERTAGTAKLRMTLRPSKTKMGVAGGKTGENADQGNRNKRS